MILRNVVVPACLLEGETATAQAGGSLTAPAFAAQPIVTGPRRTAPDRLDKSLITERDINALAASARSLRIAPSSRLTPLARDEARRRGEAEYFKLWIVLAQVLNHLTIASVFVE